MLHSTYHHKDNYEDPKTSAIFENLMLLQDNIFWYILRKSCFEHDDLPEYSGRLLSYDFWPHWDCKGTDNSNFVEPDLFLRFEAFDVILEAKYGDYGGQYLQQWRRELIAYCNEYKNEKEVIFIAIGGNQTVHKEFTKIKGKQLLIHKCNWLSILINVNKYEAELEQVTIPDLALSSTKRILENIILAFNLNGVYNISWFADMAIDKPQISSQSIDTLSTFFI